MEEELGVIYDEAFSVIQAARSALTDHEIRQSHLEARDTTQQ
jgi:hypothetical protein